MGRDRGAGLIRHRLTAGRGTGWMRLPGKQATLVGGGGGCGDKDVEMEAESWGYHLSPWIQPCLKLHNLWPLPLHSLIHIPVWFRPVPKGFQLPRD